MKKKLLTLLAIGTFIAANPAAAEDGKYSQGVFIINEDWYGTNSSSVNFLDDNGEWSYRVSQVWSSDAPPRQDKSMAASFSLWQNSPMASR